MSLNTQLTVGLQSAVLAVGKLKNYQIIIGGLQLLNLPIAYLLLKMELPAYSVLISYFCIEIINTIFRILFAKKYAKLLISEYINMVLMKEIIPILQQLLPEMTLKVYDPAQEIDYSEYNCLMIGPGWGVTDEHRDYLLLALEEAKKNAIPVVLDADALTIIAKNNISLNYR